MKRFLAALAVAAAALVGTDSAEAQETPKLVTIVGTAEPQTQLMSMVLTMQSLQKGAETYTLLCGPGGDIALKDAPESAIAPQEPKGMSPQKLMQAIMKQGGTVEVCAIYLPNLGQGPDALIEGVGVAKPGPMADRLLAPNTRIMSF
jgi:predicted peroxiredoxin